MNDVKQRNRRRRQRKRSQNHKRSVLAISAVVLMLTVMVSANSMTLKAKNREYQAQETELKEQIQAEQDRKKEIKELEKYVGTDKYVEDVAKEKLGLVHDNEIVFKSKEDYKRRMISFRKRFLKLFSVMYSEERGTTKLAKIKEQEIFVNPYVIQMDKFADSLQHLSKTFLNMEAYKGTLSREEIDEMFEKVTGNVCAGCERRGECLGEKHSVTYQMMYEILCAAEEYGAELNMELKRRLKRQCLFAPRFLRESLEEFENAKQILMWNHRLVQAREGYARQLTSFAKMIQYTTRELDAGIFQDDHLEKRIKAALKKENVKLLSVVFYMTQQGKYEVHLTVKAMKGRVVLAKDVAFLVGKCIGRTMIPRQGERLVIGEEYGTIACMEGAKFQTLQGVARIGKGLEEISGDTFLMKDLPGGRKGVALSDGMGSGEEAFRDSTMVVEMLEELLEAGFPVETAVQMMNTALVTGREEVKFCTLDVCLFDLYQGSCEFVKAGASATFIKRKKEVEKIESTTLPIGVVQNIELDREERNLESGEYVIMVTDGVMDALPEGAQEEKIVEFIRETDIVNPTEFARGILSQVLKSSGGMPMDDMTVLVIGIWCLS